MKEHEALTKMYSPGMKRPNKREPGGVMQILITNACTLSCFNCTQGSNLRGPYSFMPVDQFREACISLCEPEPYFGTVGIFGGDPPIHPDFEEICSIMREYIPWEQRGIWCNDPLGKAKIMRETFNPRVSNLNVHLSKKAYDEFKRDWPESLPFGLNQDSRHSPPWVAMQDLDELPNGPNTEENRWELISNCPINRDWSAMICIVRHQLRGFFCEIAGAHAIRHQRDPDWPDLGSEIYPGWWKQTMEDFALQAEWYCHRCSVPLSGYGELAQSTDPNAKEQVSKTHLPIYQPKVRDREVEEVTRLEQLQVGRIRKLTKYLQNSSR